MYAYTSSSLAKCKSCFTHVPGILLSSWPAPSTAVSGSIALVARGSCSHYHKARSAQDWWGR